MATTNDNNIRNNNNKHLFYLNELDDYKVASDDPDVRGWEVKDKDNRVIGKVDNLLVNKNTERVVYLDVEVDKSIIDANHEPYRSTRDSNITRDSNVQDRNGEVHEFVNKEGENHIIIPVGLVRLNDDDNFVYTDRVNHRTFAETKRVKKGAAIDRDYEVVVLDTYERGNLDKDAGTTTSAATKTTQEPISDRTTTGTTTGKIATGGDTTTNRRTEDKVTDLKTNVERTSADRSTADTGKRDTGSTGIDKEFNPEKGEGRGNEGTYRSDKDRGEAADDKFYERDEFDRKNYRRNKNS